MDMEIAWARHAIPFRPDTVLVRGRLPDGRAAIVRIPDHIRDEAIAVHARPLLVEAFARGAWFQIGDNVSVRDWGSGVVELEPLRESLIIEPVREEKP